MYKNREFMKKVEYLFNKPTLNTDKPLFDKETERDNLSGILTNPNKATCDSIVVADWLDKLTHLDNR